mmetsp:Transcript_18491/g.40011  ORF Transcript_18491/g.40011 Transcript_18491/m.40011 type:complete len:769 (-) Transcript_18491:75-2381(-)
MGICQSAPKEATEPLHHSVNLTLKTNDPQAVVGQGARKASPAANGNHAAPGFSSITDPLVSSTAFAQEKTPVNFILNLTDNKPLDASDVSSLFDAKNEIKFIRKFAADFLATSDVGDTNDDAQKDKDDHVDKGVRGALYDKQDFSSFKKVSYDKTDAVRSLIYDAIKPNVLFEHDSKEEILQIIDVFKPHTYSKGETIIKQGDEGSEFYVVESGELNIHVTVKGDNDVGGEESEVKVGNYSTGSAFGELALIFGSPRAATITATGDCKLWSIERMAYRSVISQLRYEQHLEKSAFLKTCTFDNQQFSSIFDGSQIEDLTIATKVDHYEAGEVILREGEMGDTFYIVKSGNIVYYKKGDMERQGTIEEKKAFGTTSLLKGVVSSCTYKANSPVTVFYLTRKDFEAIMGTMQNVLDGATVSRSVARSKSKKTIMTSMSMDQRYDLELNELDTFNVLGRGAFGQVSLVQAKKTKKVFALKAQSKHYIAKKGQKEHVLNEYRIMKEIDNPNMLGIHCAIQDEKYLYFLVDLLPGGELMTYLVKRARQGKGFTEDITRFYAASVVLAFEQLHPLMIAYRDLKPENIVLTKKGYGVLVDFGLAKEVDEGQTYSFCGTPDYLAPEIIRGTGHDWAVDCWGLGVFLFEMTNGTAPFYATNQARRTRKILKGFEFVKTPSHFSGGLTDLISNLLINDQSKRLGRTQNGIQGIKNHRWFAGFDWEGFEKRSLEAPIQPNIPADIKTIGKKQLDSNPFQEAAYAPVSDWWPDLKNLEQW